MRPLDGESGPHGPAAPSCPVFYPTKEEFSKDFTSYIRSKFKKDPDLGMFRVVPPASWSPRKCSKFPDLRYAHNCGFGP